MLDIGNRLRRVREARALSQRQLSRLAGISNATISQIESNTINPSVGALKRILDAIPMGLAEFFAEDEPQEQKKIFFKSSELVEIGRGGVSYRQVAKQLSDKAIQLILEHYKPGAHSGRVPITHEGEEAGIIIKGHLEVTVGEQKQVLGPGDAYYFRSHEPHRFRNVGAEPCEVVSACTPPSF